MRFFITNALQLAVTLLASGDKANATLWNWSVHWWSPDLEEKEISVHKTFYSFWYLSICMFVGICHCFDRFISTIARCGDSMFWCMQKDVSHVQTVNWISLSKMPYVKWKIIELNWIDINLQVLRFFIYYITFD